MKKLYKAFIPFILGFSLTNTVYALEMTDKVVSHFKRVIHDCCRDAINIEGEYKNNGYYVNLKGNYIKDYSFNNIVIKLAQDYSGELIVVYSDLGGEKIKPSENYEANPVWRKLLKGESSCAVDSLWWSYQCFEKLYKNLGESKYKIILEEGYIFDLPTEAQWEYACRAGINDSRYGKLDEIAWYDDNAAKTTHVIGQKKPNAWGIYDMLGNVFEYCKDEYDNNITYKKDDVYNDPYIYTSSFLKYVIRGGSLKYVIRGGSWNSSSRTVRAAYRDFNYNSYCDDYCGFRVAIVKK